MAITRAREVAVHVRDTPGNIVTPIPLGVTLRDFTESVLPYILVEDDAQVVGDWGGMERVIHTTCLKDWEVRLVQHLVAQPLQKKAEVQ